MTRLSFRFTPLESVDFDVCAGPPRPEPPSAGHGTVKPAPARPVEVEKIREPAEG